MRHWIVAFILTVATVFIYRPLDGAELRMRDMYGPDAGLTCFHPSDPAIIGTLFRQTNRETRVTIYEVVYMENAEMMQPFIDYYNDVPPKTNDTATGVALYGALEVPSMAVMLFRDGEQGRCAFTAAPFPRELYEQLMGDPA